MHPHPLLRGRFRPAALAPARLRRRRRHILLQRNRAARYVYCSWLVPIIIGGCSGILLLLLGLPWH